MRRGIGFPEVINGPDWNEPVCSTCSETDGATRQEFGLAAELLFDSMGDRHVVELLLTHPLVPYVCGELDFELAQI